VRGAATAPPGDGQILGLYERRDGGAGSNTACCTVQLADVSASNLRK
jgi:hypothetical protein